LAEVRAMQTEEILASTAAASSQDEKAQAAVTPDAGADENGQGVPTEPAVGQSAEIAALLKQQQSPATKATKGKPSDTGAAEGAPGAPAPAAGEKPKKPKKPAAAGEPKGPDAAKAPKTPKAPKPAKGPKDPAAPDAKDAAPAMAATPDAKDAAPATAAASDVKDAAPAPAATPDAKDAAPAPATATDAKAPAAPDASAPAVAPAPSPPAPKGGGVDWDSEVAWHDHFQQFKGAGGGAAAAGGGGAAPAAASPDRGQMVLDALKGGAGEGLKEGATAFLIESAVNAASSKIPMAASILETGRLIKTLSQGGPQAWLEQSITGQNAIVGKWGDAFTKLSKGGIVDKIEGVVNLLEGASSLIGTLNSILWIVAGVGFLASLAFPALLPFVVLASQWAMTLSKVSTIIDVFTTLLRLVVMAGRSLEILYSDASPEELLKKQESLKGQTKDFTKEASSRALSSGRERVQDKVKARRAAAAAPPAPAPAPAAASAAPKPSMSSRILNVLGMAAGDFRGADADGNRGLGRDFAEAKQESGRALDVSRAFGGKTDTATKLDKMEQAGATVFLNEKHEKHVDEGLRASGQKGTVRLEEQRAKARLTAATAEAQRVETAANAERDRLAAAAETRKAAEDRLDEARAAQRPAIAEAEAVANARRGELVTLDAEVRRTQAQLQQEQEVLTQAQYCQAHDQAGAKSGQYDDIVATSRANVAELEGRLSDAQRAVALQRVSVQQAEAQVGERRAALQAIEADAAAAAQAERAAATKVAAANQAQQGAAADRAAEQQRFDGRDAARAGAAEKKGAENAAGASAHRAWLAFDGAGPTRLHGPENSAGRSAIDILDGTHKPGEKTAVGALESLAGGVDAVDQSMSGKSGASGQNASPIADRVRERLARLAEELPAPPTQARAEGQSAAARLNALDQEEEDLRNKRLSVSTVKGQMRQETAALGTLAGAAKAGQAATGAQAKQAETLSQKQDKAGQQVGQDAAKGGEAAGKGAEAQGLMNPIVGGMLKLMGLIPSKVTSKGAQGAAATQQLASGLKDQGAATKGAQSMSDQAKTDIGQMKQETAGAGGEAQALGQELATTEQALAAKQAETTQLDGQLGEADAAGAQRLQAIATERQQLAQLQTGALARADEWVHTHAGVRTKGVAEAEALAAQAGAGRGAKP
jgi:hypothetical protein